MRSSVKIVALAKYPSVFCLLAALWILHLSFGGAGNQCQLMQIHGQILTSLLTTHFWFLIVQKNGFCVISCVIFVLMDVNGFFSTTIQTDRITSKRSGC